MLTLWPPRWIAFRKIEALTAPTLNVTSGLDIFRFFLLSIGNYLFDTIDKTMVFINLSADSPYRKRAKAGLWPVATWPLKRAFDKRPVR